MISTYLFSQDVSLDARGVEVASEDSDEYVQFGRMLRVRHAVACGLRLKPIVGRVERGISHISQMVRSESKGNIFGRLDIQLYLNRRTSNLSWPRNYPVLIAEDTPNTSENQLIAQTLQELGRRLTDVPLNVDSAERNYSQNLLRWVRDTLAAEPWSRVSPARGIQRLRRETEHRLRKRQTGNEQAYGAFLAWHDQWLFDAARSSPDELESLLSLLFAFPPGEFFEDRVFEIWCLHQVIEAFRRIGGVVLQGPLPLFDRSKFPICRMRYGNYHFDIWFQRALPSGGARWQYLSSRRPLVGIPDITVVGLDGRRLLVDAKRRSVTTQTRPEETYKMLGYLENFRTLFTGDQFWGVLCFLSEQGLFTEVVGEGGQKLFLIGAHDQDPSVCAFAGRMDTALAEWLARYREDPVPSRNLVPIRVM